MRKELGLPIILLAAALNCFPQELPIVSQVDLLPDGHVTISVKNTSPQPIAALVAVAERIPLDRSVPGGRSVRFFDTITNFAHDRPLLRGDANTFTFGGPRPGPLRVRYEVRCEAGILADGTTFGDPTWAARLLSRRTLGVAETVLNIGWCAEREGKDAVVSINWSPCGDLYFPNATITDVIGAVSAAREYLRSH
jgi:hypothetical protein